MKKFLLFISVLIIIFIPKNIFAFADVNSHWAKPFVSWASKNELIKGYPNGTFKPDANITNAEFYTIVNHFAKYNTFDNIHFKDVKKSDWFYSEVCRGVKAGYIKDSNLIISPNKFITRDEASRIIASIYSGYSQNKLGFIDSISIVNKSEVSFLVDRKIISGYPDGSFKPLGLITRGEAAAMFYNADKNLGEATKDFIYITIMAKLDSREDSVVNNIKVQKNKKFEDSTNFNLSDGYTFDGYYLDKERTKKADLNKGFDEDTTLYAKFKGNFVKLSFYTVDKNKRKLVAKFEIPKGKSLDLNSIPILPMGYAGWFTDRKGEDYANFEDGFEKNQDFYGISNSNSSSNSNLEFTAAFVFPDEFGNSKRVEIPSNSNGYLDLVNIPTLPDGFKWSLASDRYIEANPLDKIDRNIVFYGFKVD